MKALKVVMSRCLGEGSSTLPCSEVLVCDLLFLFYVCVESVLVFGQEARIVIY